MRRKTSTSSDQAYQSCLAEALKRLIGLLARQAAREMVISIPAPSMEPADE
jgi:hypothetical protein